VHPTPAATIDVTITGGTGPFSYQFNGVQQLVVLHQLLEIHLQLTNTCGNVLFVITDSYTPTCSVTTNPVEVTTPVTPAFTTVATDVT
jgi:hypothetical protein